MTEGKVFIIISILKENILKNQVKDLSSDEQEDKVLVSERRPIFGSGLVCSDKGKMRNSIA
jgi:hypothetical protein